MPAVAIPREYEGTVTASEFLSPKIMLVQLSPTTPVTYVPGQYASWLINEHRRPLSYATPAGYPYLEFVIDISPGGVASRYTEQLKPQDTVRFLSPYGRFIVASPPARPLLFLATGSGIAPIRAQILQLLADQVTQSITLFFGNRDEHYFFFDDEFTELAHIHDSFTFVPVCSEPSSAWTGERGLVTEVMMRHITDWPSYEAYVCGSPAMVKDSMAILEKAGVPRVQIHGEQFT